MHQVPSLEGLLDFGMSLNVFATVQCYLSRVVAGLGSGMV